MPNNKGSRGSVLVDWSTAVSLAATTAMLTVPGLRTFVHESQRSAVVNEVQLDVRRAARLANELGRAVTLCASVHGRRCDAGDDWNGGWLAFVDGNGNGRMDARERRLWRTRNPQAGMGVFAAPAVITFRPWHVAPYRGSTEAQVTVWDRLGHGGARTVAIGPAGVPELSEVRYPPRGQDAH